jgi:hypothetical protein
LRAEWHIIEQYMLVLDNSPSAREVDIIQSAPAPEISGLANGRSETFPSAYRSMNSRHRALLYLNCIAGTDFTVLASIELWKCPTTERAC